MPRDAFDVERTVIADGFWSVDDICTKRLRNECRRAGLL
jgi:hypothetical protein